MSEVPPSQLPPSTPAERVHVELDNEDLDSAIATANERKQSGNDVFRTGKWEEAIASYEAALNALPRRREDNSRSNETIHNTDDNGEDSLNPPTPPSNGKGKQKEDEEAEDEEAEDEEVISPEVKALNEKCAQLRAVLHANIGACYVKMGDHKQAVESCTEALKDDPLYIKALERRASSNDVLDTWSSLTAAQEGKVPRPSWRWGSPTDPIESKDYEKLLALPTLPTSQRPILTRKLQTLKPRLETAQKRETAEMVDKLKGLGNSILGKFGLSTDNFKFEPNGQGGYSMNFVR